MTYRNDFKSAAKEVKRLEQAFSALFEVSRMIDKIGDADRAFQEMTAKATEASNDYQKKREELFDAEKKVADAYVKADDIIEEAEAKKQDAAKKIAAADAYFADVKVQAEGLYKEAEKKANDVFEKKVREMDAELDAARAERNALAGEINELNKANTSLKAEFEALKAKFS